MDDILKVTVDDFALSTMEIILKNELENGCLIDFSIIADRSYKLADAMVVEQKKRDDPYLSSVDYLH